MNGDAGRTLPHNLEAERSILGAVLLHNDALNEAAEIVTDAHFYRKAHRRIYRHMVELSIQGVDIDLVTLKESLSRAGDLEEVGGPAYIAALADGMPRSTNIAHYARIVKDKADLRAVIFAASKMISAAYDVEDDARNVVEQAERAIFAIADRHHQGFVPMSTLMSRAVQRLEVMRANGGAITGLSTGFTDLDTDLRGLQSDNLIIIAGRPSMGKTALVMNIAEHVAVNVGKTVGVFSLEQSDDELAMRSIASQSRINGHKMQTGYLAESEWGRLAAAIGRLSQAKLYVDPTPTLSVFEMRARARRLKAEHPDLALIVIDYLQLMISHEKKAENRTLELGAITRTLKTALARDLGVPVVVLSQLSRGPELRSDHRPMLSDLRESGSIEQDADVVLFVYRDEYYNRDRDDNKGVAELIIAKQRNGPIGIVKLDFQKEITRFENRTRTEGYGARAAVHRAVGSL